MRQLTTLDAQFLAVESAETYGAESFRPRPRPCRTMIVPIPTDEAHALRRLERTHEVLRGAKERHRALPANLLTDATAFIPPAVASLAARTTMQLLGRTRPPAG